MWFLKKKSVQRTDKDTKGISAARQGILERDGIYLNGIDRQVAYLTAAYGTADPFELCRCMGIYVLDVELPDRLWGFYSNLIGSKIIYLNNAMEPHKRRQVCAHELGHAVLHADMNTMFLQKRTRLVAGRYEREADCFAACLLIPDELLADQSGVLDTVEALSACTGVSSELVRLRLQVWNETTRGEAGSPCLDAE